MIPTNSSTQPISRRAPGDNSVGVSPDYYWSITHVLVLVLVFACFIILLHRFYQFIGRAPYLAVDDTLANVAFNLSNFGQYGFPASPVQALSGAERLTQFLNYGPWPFYIGAFLDWVFGASYVTQRSTHLLALIIPSIAFWLAFRRLSVAALGAFVMLVVSLFWEAEWPMVRPDFAVAVFSGCALACFTTALLRPTGMAWFAAGFCAASAATTHPIALVLLPWAFVLWGISQLLFARWVQSDSRNSQMGWHRSFAFLTAGSAGGILIFLIAIRFNIPALINLWSAGGQFLHERTVSLVSTLVGHFRSAWSISEAAFWIILAGFCASLAVVLSLFLIRFRRRDLIWAILAPSISLALAYQLSLAVYSNFHQGYSVLSHLATAWAAAALIAATVAVIGEISLPLARSAELILRCGVIILVGYFSAHLLTRSDHWPAMAKRQVDYRDYIHEVLSLLPQNTTVWGDLIFGLKSGGSLQMIQFGDAIALAQRFRPNFRQQFAPDYVLANAMNSQLAWATVRSRSGKPLPDRPFLGGLPELKEVFPSSQFKLMALIDAPPYGTTRVYGRQPQNTSAEHRPLIAVNDGVSSSWAKMVGSSVPFVEKSVPPAHFNLTLYGTFEASADRSVAVELEPGLYLVTVAVNRTNDDGVGLVLAANTAQFTGYAGDLPFAISQAPYFPEENLVYLIARHLGGTLYLSQFDARSGAGFTVSDVQKIEYLSPPREPVASVSIPLLSEWMTPSDARGATYQNDGRVRVVGNQSASYQFWSPMIPVPKETSFVFSSDLSVSFGEVAIGIRDEDGNWLVSPVAGRRDFEVSTKNNSKISIVVTALAPPSEGRPIEFLLGEPVLTRDTKVDYIKQLAGCLLKRDYTFCNHRIPPLPYPMPPTPQYLAPSEIIMALDDTDWDEIVPPARRKDGRLRILGPARMNVRYGAISLPYRLPKGGRVGAAGTVREGSIVLGLLDEKEKWVAITALSPGPFRTAVEVPKDGEYRIVVANNLPAGQKVNDAEVTEIGLVGLDPVAVRVASPPSAAPKTPQAQRQIDITPLEETAWESVWPPTRREGQRLVIAGEPSSASAYGAMSVRYRLPKGTLVGAAGTVREGGLVLGLLDSRDQWAVTTALSPGPFRTAMEVPKDGQYRIVVANNLRSGQKANDAEVTEIGLVGLDPVAVRAQRQIDQTDITPLEETAWESVWPPTRREGQRLIIAGEPSSASAYGAMSVRYRLPKGTLVGTVGTVRDGGLVLGLLDSRDQWAVTAAISPGPFRTAVEVPKDGEYRIVVANNLPAGQKVNDAEVAEIGLVGLDPAAVRVASPPSAAPWSRFEKFFSPMNRM